MPTPENIAKALKDLAAAGAEVRESSKSGNKITASVIEGLSKGMSPQFDAWVSWSKSIP